MRRRFSDMAFAFAVATLLGACGGSQPAASSPADSGAAASEASPDVWSDSMSDKQKGAFMKKKVVPAMAEIFKAHDPEKFANVGCKTCHGPQFKPHPADFLPALDMKDGKLAQAETHPEMVQFMGEQVSPKMAELFGKKPFDPATGEGFGCNGCHKINQ